MVTTLRGTDPGSVSRLGGLLRTTADALSGDLAALPATSPLAQLATVTADQVDAIGSALQVHAQELAEAAAAYSRLQERAAALGLIVTDWTVSEPFGLIGSDVAARRCNALDFRAVMTPPSSPTTTIEVIATETSASISVYAA